MTHDVVEVPLIFPIGHHRELEAFVLIIRKGLVEDIRQELRAFLDRIQPAGPEKKRGIRVAAQAGFFLEQAFGGTFSFDEVIRVVFDGKSGVGGGIVGIIRRIQDAHGAAGIPFVFDLRPHGVRNKGVMAIGDLVEEGRADGIDVVRGKNPGGEQIDRGAGPGGFIVVRNG